MAVACFRVAHDGPGMPGDIPVPGRAGRVRGVAGVVVVEVSCRVCPGLIDRVPRAQAAQAAWEHFAQVHPGSRSSWAGVPVEGEQYLVLPAALVCDACLAVLELPWWEHTSTPPTPAAGQGDRDGRWLLCDACHGLAAAGRLSPWVRHAWASHLDRAPWLATASPARRLDTRAHLAATLRTLLERLDPGQRITL